MGGKGGKGYTVENLSLRLNQIRHQKKAEVRLRIHFTFIVFGLTKRNRKGINVVHDYCPNLVLPHGEAPDFL